MSNPRTIVIPGDGTSTGNYELAPGLVQYVQAVRIVVDNTGGADAHPNLSVSEQSGVVITDTPQSGTIPAGEADAAATWALRLTDDGDGSGGVTEAPWCTAIIPHNTSVTASTTQAYNLNTLTTNDPGTYELTSGQLQINKPGTYEIIAQSIVYNPPMTPVSNPWETDVYVTLVGLPSSGPLTNQQSDAIGVKTGASTQRWYSTCRWVITFTSGNVGVPFSFFYGNTIATDLLVENANVSIQRIDAVGSGGGGSGGAVSSVSAADTSVLVTPTIGDVTVGLPAPSGSLAGSWPSPSLTASGVSAATYGDATHSAQIAIAADGRITSASNVAITGGGSGGRMTLVTDTRNTDLTVNGSSGSPNTFITGTAHTYSGSTVVLVHFSLAVAFAGSQVLVIELYEDTTLLGRLTQTLPGGTFPVDRWIPRTPSAGSHQYVVKAWKNGGTDGTLAAASPYTDALLEVVAQ